MTKAKISQYDAVASNNTDVNGVNIAEGCPPSGMNNMGREIMAALKRFQVGSDGDGVTVGGNLVVSGSSTVNTFTAGPVSATTLNTSGAVVFNDAGADVDFRVESDTNENALFVDGGTGNVGMGRSPVSLGSSITSLSIEGANGGGLYLSRTSATVATCSFNTINGATFLRTGEATPLLFGTNGTERMRITSDNLLLYAGGFQPATKRNASFSVPGSGSATAFDLWSSNEGRGLYLVSVVRRSGNVGTKVVAIVGSVSSSVSVIYDVLSSTALSLTASGSSIVVNNSTTTVTCSAVAIPLAIDGV